MTTIDSTNIGEYELIMASDQAKVENKKTTKTDHEKSLSKEFIRALGLLYSPEAKSAEQLRLMLEIEIAKQRRPKRPKTRTYQKRPKRRKVNADIVEKNSQEKKDSSGKKVDSACNLEPSLEEAANRDDIPTISIPDEDQNDEVVCKVCNFPEFGSLTLMQCNTCEKYYHPLCHQPAIVDACLQKSNSSWQCDECKKVLNVE